MVSGVQVRIVSRIEGGFLPGRIVRIDPKNCRILVASDAPPSDVQRAIAQAKNRIVTHHAKAFGITPMASVGS